MTTAPASELVEQLRCPLCRKVFYGLWINSVDFRADLGCQRKDCPQKWWAMYLSPGGVESQLASVFGEDVAAHHMAFYRLPARLDREMFWQLSLRGNQLHHRRNERDHGQPPAA